MSKLTKLAVAIGAVAMLAACGGGDDEEGGIYLPSYGSVAINQITGASGMTANYQSQRDANNKAKDLCGTSCITVLEFGSYKCGALARAQSTPTFGWASNSKSSDSKTNALNQCQANGGISCSIVLDQCNDY